MSSILDSVDQRTQLVGENRMELLMFRLQGPQVYAINVFKVQEVQRMPKLTLMPKRHSIVSGITHVRGLTIPVIDLSKAIGQPPVDDPSTCNVIITEYNKSVQAFMVGAVDRIINLNWEQIQAPPRGSGQDHYLTSLCQVQDKIVEIIDVEKVLAKVRNYDKGVTAEAVIDNSLIEFASTLTAFAVDDSSTALQQIKTILNTAGLNLETTTDGAKALRHLKKLADEGVNLTEKYAMLITDAEMPEMDGYRLTSEIRADPRLRDLYVIMHTSLSGNFNNVLTEKVGCDHFISKFQPDELVQIVQSRIRDLSEAS